MKGYQRTEVLTYSDRGLFDTAVDHMQSVTPLEIKFK
jgi:hypothetical protein